MASGSSVRTSPNFSGAARWTSRAGPMWNNGLPEASLWRVRASATVEEAGVQATTEAVILLRSIRRTLIWTLIIVPLTVLGLLLTIVAVGSEPQPAPRSTPAAEPHVGACRRQNVDFDHVRPVARSSEQASTWRCGGAGRIRTDNLTGKTQPLSTPAIPCSYLGLPAAIPCHGCRSKPLAVDVFRHYVREKCGDDRALATTYIEGKPVGWSMPPRHRAVHRCGSRAPRPRAEVTPRRSSQQRLVANGFCSADYRSRSAKSSGRAARSCFRDSDA
ncbi:hypothetical protein SAMN05421507_11199 [Lentzea jiangxiensis]|uniref:Uncharacterized protein n=1 Tax=Lentzea jiangxiensis TaxID=641025 RepID=A0A1H0U473_9PSEU|nr:hypothetical protein SAMN05421507_11199 [Lentzea jiangxiensis]